MELSIDNIPYVATAMAQGDVLSKVGTSVLSQTLDTASAQMDNLAKVMELSVNPAIGGNFDMSI